VPVSCATRRRVHLDTWDRFIVPLPFGSGAFVCGEPMRVLEPADEEAGRRELEAALNAVSRKADALAQ
jgi:lysophospholipid acyltransferase (LPLAT)-like uncharacterized protein